MTELLQQYSDAILTAFSQPDKRVFIGYLCTALLLALLWLISIERLSITQSFRTIFSAKVWFSASAKADYRIFLINSFLMLLLSPRLLSQLALATALFFWLHDITGGRTLLLTSAPDWLIGAIFTLCFFIVDDLSRYLVHRALHRFPILWAFHKVHHSAESLTPMTVFRTHPVEALIFSLRSILVQAGMIALFIFFLGDRAALITVLGANLFTFVFNLLGSNLRHSHIAIRYWQPLEKILLSPAQHQIHHSVEPRHWNKNYGVALAIWDLLGNSHHHSESQGKLTFGLRAHQAKHFHSLKGIYLQPCQEATELVIRRLSKLPKLGAKTLRQLKALRPTHSSKQHSQSTITTGAIPIAKKAEGKPIL